MAILPILSAPHPVLENRTRRVRVIDATIEKLISDMTETMYAANGVGLAANQVGVPLQVCVIRIPEEDHVRVLINPSILVRKGERELEEACLSIPGYRGLVKRSNEVRVRAKDQNGKQLRIKATDNLLAQALEHEIDHLNGVLYVNHLVDRDSIWKLNEVPEENTEIATEEGLNSGNS